ncbi:MAG: dihydropteroate synthase, partial [Clostridiales bacterium]|nr:dihydropteroate synthase [Clostridiales bacterium]
VIGITCLPDFEKDFSVSCSTDIIERIRKKYNTPICVDVSKAESAKKMLSSGADIINDIWAVRKDNELAKVVATYKAGIILIHNTMHGIGDDVMGKIMSMMRKSIEVCQGAGIGINRIVADPGLGFGKTMEQNLEIIRKLKEIKSLGVPLMVGPSGKSLYKNVMGKSLEESSEIIASVAAASIINGADIIRVHDVRQMKEAAKITDAIINK